METEKQKNKKMSEAIGRKENSIFGIFETLLNGLKSAMINILIILFVGLLLFHTYKESNTKYIIIEPFEVPERVEKDGFTGRLFANRILDQINLINKKANNSKALPFVSQSEISDFEVEVPGAGISLATVSKIIRKIIGKEPLKVTGEVYFVHDELFVTVRSSGKASHTSKMSVAAIDSTANIVSKAIIKQIQPLTLYLYEYELDKKCTSCIEIIKYAIDNDPKDDDAQAYHSWGYLLHEDEKYSESIIKYKKALSIDPKYAMSFNNLGAVLKDLNKTVRAMEMYKKAIKVDSKCAIAYVNLGSTLSTLYGDHESAIAYYKQAIDSDPKEAYAYSQWANTLLLQMDYKGAVLKMREALEIEPKGIPYYLELATMMTNHGKYKPAIDLYKQAYEIDSTNINVLTAWGTLLYTLNDSLSGSKKFRQAIRIEPSNSEIYNNWSWAFYDKKDWKRSEMMSKRAIQINSQNDESYRILGLTYAIQEDYSSAINQYNKALEINPRFADVYNDLGNAHRNTHKYELAVEQYKKALAIDSGNVVSYYLWGYLLKQKGEFSQAIKKFEIASKTNPRNSIVYYYWGNLLLEGLDEPEKAVVKYSKALEISPRDIDCLIELSIAYRKMRSYTDAIKIINKAIRLEPHNAEAYSCLGDIYLHKNENNAASTNYKIAYSLVSDSVLKGKICNNWGVVLMKLDNNVEAANLFKKAIKLSPEFTYSHISLGDALVKLGKYQAALSSYQAALKYYPNDEELLKKIRNLEHI